MHSIVMKKYILLLLFFFGIASTASAQQETSNTITASINVNATVIRAIELVTVNNIRLRNFQRDQTEVYISPITSVDAGHMIAFGNPNANIRIEFLRNRVLTQIDGEGLLRFDYEVSANEVDNQTTSELLLNDNRNLKFNQEGEFFIWIGGRVNIEQALPGAYAGEFTIEIEYI